MAAPPRECCRLPCSLAPFLCYGRYADRRVIGQLSLASGREARHSLHPYFTITLATERAIVLAPGLGRGEGEAQTMGEDLAFGGLLRRFRLTASLSQAVLAERAHVSTNAIAALERGRRG